jgi:hypothetical protein
VRKARPAAPDRLKTNPWGFRPSSRRRMSMSEPTRSRAVFSTEDFELMKEAVADYIKKIQDEPRSSKFVNLYHRLGRLG